MTTRRVSTSIIGGSTSKRIRPRYAFGHGLSYTNFSYSNATIEKITQLDKYPPQRPAKGTVLDYSQTIPSYTEAIKPNGFHTIWRYLYSWLSESDAKAAAEKSKTSKYPYPDSYSDVQMTAPSRAGGAQSGNPALWDEACRLSVTVTNVGVVFAGKASLQAYVQFPDDITYDTPVIQLRDFEKSAELAPGESERLEFVLTRKDLSVWDVEAQDWAIPEVDGKYRVWLGGASDDLRVVCFADSWTCEAAGNGPI